MIPPCPATKVNKSVASRCKFPLISLLEYFTAKGKGNRSGAGAGRRVKKTDVCVTATERRVQRKEWIMELEKEMLVAAEKLPSEEESTAGDLFDQAILDAFTLIQQFVSAWGAENRNPDDYIFYRLRSRSGGCWELRLSDLRKVGEVIQAGVAPASPPRTRRRLSDQERERRRQRMKDYWIKKRGEAQGEGHK
jgi:hypothetical protein